MATQEKMLIVVNPAASQQPAVDRVENIARNSPFTELPEVTLLVAVDPSSTDTRADNAAVYRDDEWLSTLKARLADAKLSPQVRISWSREWADAILYSAAQISAHSILVSHPGKSANKSFSDEFWYLVRNSPLPVSVVQSARAPKGRPVVVSMDLQARELSDLNQRILEAGRVASQMYGGELHLVNAYQDSMNYPDRGRLVELTGIPNERIHLKAGEVYSVLHEVARELDPDMFIVGATRRTGIRAAMRGRKLGDILMTIEHDLLVIV